MNNILKYNHSLSSQVFKNHFLNKFLMIEIVSFFLGFLLWYDGKNPSYSFIMLVLSFVSGVYLYISKRGNYLIALHANLISVNIFLFFACLYLGSKSGVYLMYFPILIGYSFMLDLDNKKELWTYILFSAVLLCFAILNEEVFKIINLETPLVNNYQFSIFVLIAFGLVGFGSILTMQVFHRQKQELWQHIEDQKEVELKLNQTLKDKEVLLAEVYHRVKNNLTVVTSLINLQINTIENEYTKGVLLDCKNRIASMSMIHQKFYQGKNYSRIDFKSYIHELVSEINFAYNITDKDVKVNLLVDDDINFDLNTAIPCGIILNELISNAFKHAFKHTDIGRINVSLQREKKMYLLRVQDDGVGFDYDEAVEKINSLGLVLIESLTQQLDGNFQYFGHAGTDFRMLFNAEANNPI